MSKGKSKQQKMRKLASIQKIESLSPIEGSDNIEVAQVLGWYLVVKKGEFSVGDLAVYCEIDSVMPNRPAFEFLKPRGMRIRTVRLRGQISQGICFPLSILPDGFNIELGADCTEVLGITKYEPPMPACLGGDVKGNFPSFIPKTDEPRVQGLKGLLEKEAGRKCYVTEKLDGSSVTYYIKDGVFGVCSRNLELKETEGNTYWKVAREMDIESKIRKLERNIAFQGELIGEGIQKNKLKINGHTVMFFSVFDIDNQRYFDPVMTESFIRAIGLSMVPVLSRNYELSSDIDELVKMATKMSVICPETWAEGVVIRPLSKWPNNDSFSFKVINPEFLIGNKE